MKILFLDVDGVINNAKSSLKELWPLDQYAAFLVGKIVLDTDCKVVLSSSWRHHPEVDEMMKKRVVEIYDHTPTSRRYPDRDMRGYEIQDWLDAHPDVERYAILDDDSDMLESQKPNFFKTEWQEGLTDEIAGEIIAHLNK